MGFSKFPFCSERIRLLEVKQREQREQEQLFQISFNQNKSAVGKCCANNLCKYEYMSLQDKICDRCNKIVHILCEKWLTQDNYLVFCLCYRSIRDEARK